MPSFSSASSGACAFFCPCETTLVWTLRICHANHEISAFADSGFFLPPWDNPCFELLKSAGAGLSLAPGKGGSMMCDVVKAGNRQNAPSFIYEILYGARTFLPGRSDSHVQKSWQGIWIDEHIPAESLDRLNAIDQIELRSSCEGSGPERPTFLIIRFRNEEDLTKINDFVTAMNAFEDVKCGAGRGSMGLVRVGLTTPLWYEKNRPQFEKWWLDLPTKIRIALDVLETLYDLS